MNSISLFVFCAFRGIFLLAQKDAKGLLSIPREANFPRCETE